MNEFSNERNASKVVKRRSAAIPRHYRSAASDSIVASYLMALARAFARPLSVVDSELLWIARKALF